MRRSNIILFAVLLYSLCGCSSFTTYVVPGNTEMPSDADSDNVEILPDADPANIKTLKGWSFQYNQGTNDYSLFFGLLDGGDEAVSANVDVDIRIVNDSGEEVYSATNSVTDNDFGYYESTATGERYLANVRIPASEIELGMSSNGTVYFTVYKGDSVRFDEVDCRALYCLPVRDIELTVENLPVELKVKGYDGGTESIIEITEVLYSFEKEYIPQLKITLIGQKTYGNSSNYDIISYKLYDSEGYMVETGSVYLRSLDNGDKFKDDSIVVYDVTPGESYLLRLKEYSW